MPRLGLGLGLNRIAGGTDSVAPTVVSATIPAPGVSLILVFSEAVTGFTVGANGFTITPSGPAASLVYLSGNGTATVTFTTSRTIGIGETISRTYAPGVIADLAGNALVGFSESGVTNDSTQPPFNALLAPGGNPVLAPGAHYLLGA